MNGYRWARPGDVNAFFGLVLDNFAGLILIVSLLAGAFDFPAIFALQYMVPGTALGVLVGDLAFTWMAFRVAKREGRSDITAMPLGLDTPSTIGIVLFVVGPAFLDARDHSGMEVQDAAQWAWQIGMCSLITSGVFKLLCSLFADAVHRAIPRAGLLGSLAAIALVLISFIQLVKLVSFPMVGIVSLTIILLTLTARVRLPGNLPGSLVAIVVGTAVYYVLHVAGMLHVEAGPEVVPQLAWRIPWPQLHWMAAFRDSLAYLPVVIPFALATVVGGIDCAESAAAAGDRFDTRKVIAVEGVATLIAGLCGGIIQTTPYIGHPAYKAMGGRAAYTLATAVVIGLVGFTGAFSYLFAWVPEAAVLPILVFIGLEITGQSFAATPRRHYPAVAIACIPALAYLVLIWVDQVLSLLARQAQIQGQDIIAFVAQSDPALATTIQTLRTLSGGPGFIITSLIWSAALASLVDRRLRIAAQWYLLAGGLVLFGIIHSPLAGGRLFLPWDRPALPEVAANQTHFHVAGAYLLSALLLLGWSRFVPPMKKLTTEDPAAESAEDPDDA